MPKAMATLDPKVAIFIMGTLGIVALGGMVLGYDVDLRVLGNGVQLSKPTNRNAARRYLVSAPYE
jgi:hypothetical protein